MSDDFLGAEWSANRHHLSSAFHKLLNGYIAGIEGLTRQQFAAPWRRPDRAAPEYRP